MKTGIGMPRIRLPLTAIAFLLCLAPYAQAASDCGTANPTNMQARHDGGRHHPIGSPLPRTAEFNQPIRCDDDNWFYDLNHDGRPDPGEPRLFGPDRITACSSCHAATPDAKTRDAAHLFLRQDASELCLVCHRK